MELAITLDNRAGRPLHHQLYQELRRSILSGRLTAGQRIPSTRALAKSLGISRATVTQSYEQLASEGYLETAVGSGTCIASQLPEDLLHAAPLKARQPRTTGRQTPPVRLSNYGQSLVNVARDANGGRLLFNFKYCRPAVDHFPLAHWRRLLLRHCRTGQSDMLDYATDGKGHRPLREAIARYLARARAVQCTAEQIIIVNGSQQALHFCAQVFLDAGDVAAIEEPAYAGARHAFLTHGARLHLVPVDESGIVPGALPEKGARLLYVTPSHQFPTGAVLTLPRRLELLAWAERTGSLIIEDDYDSEFRYGGRPVPSLQGLAQNANVLYAGTFSKVLFPALRMGYLVVPPALSEVLERAKWVADRHTPMLEQRALADFINAGHLERHLRRMRTLYDKRRQKLVAALEEQFGKRVTIVGENSGMHVMIRLKTKWTDHEVLERAAAAGVGLLSARVYHVGKCRGDEFVLGYTALNERKIQEGIRRLAAALA